MTQHGAQNGLAASEQHLLQLIRQFADVINHETDYLARVESELKSSISERRAEIDKQRRIKLTELSNRATAESIAAKENIHDLARKLGLNPQSGVPQFLYLGDIEPLKVAGLTDQISKIPMMLPLFDQGGVAVIADEERGLEVIASMVFRAVDKARPRSVSVHLLNPSLLDEMSVFSALNSGGSNEFGSASTSEDIEQILTFLAERIQENMQLLQGEYRHLGDYLARRSGRDRHRYHLLCVAGKAKSFEGYMPQILQLMKQGPRYGVSTLIQIEPDALPELIDPLKDLEFAKLLVLLKSVNELKVSALVGGESFTVEAPQLSNSASRTRLNVLAQQGANLKPPVVSLVGTLPKFMWREDSRDGLRVSLGEQGDQSAEIVIGDSGRNLNNVLVGGAAGSGKTVLLLTLIYGLAYRYSPDELMMYLLDYKEGVEFARFASGETYLPHARIIGIESDKALGTSVLASLIDEIGSRSKLFKEVGAEKLSEYREKTRKKLPRILLVVDEFQLMLRDSDENVTTLKDVVRRGRSFGVHVVLSSQTLQGIEGATAEIFDQFKLRICTKAAPDTSEEILGYNNRAASELEGPPEAIVNEDFGQLAHNRKIQVARGDPSELEQLDKRFHSLLCGNCGDPLFKRGQKVCLNCKSNLPESQYLRPPLAVREGYFEPNSDVLVAPEVADRRDSSEVAACALGRPFNPSGDKISVEFGPAYSHLMIIGRGRQEAVGILQNVLIQLSLQHKPGMIFIFGAPSLSEATALPELNGLRDVIERAGHYVYSAKSEEDLLPMLAMNRNCRTFVVLPEADLFPQKALSYGEVGVLGELLESGDREKTHLIGWWERRGAPSRVHPDFLNLTIPKIALNVIRNEITDYGTAEWPWRSARAFYWNSSSIENGEWFVPYEVHSAEALGGIRYD